MKKRLILSLLLFGATTSPEEKQKVVVLESNLLKLVDGFLINANTIELTRNYQRQILHIIYGNKEADGSRLGDYEFNGKKYTIHDLSHVEQKIIDRKDSYSPEEYERLTGQLQKLLNQAKDDFIEKSHKFRAIGAGSKHITSKLIEESCKKRGRRNSILLIWGNAPEEEEDKILYEEVHSFVSFEQFAIDLLNFFDDLIHSCPKAQEKFKARLHKWTKLKEIMPMILPKHEHDSPFEHEFLKYFKEHHIDSYSIEQINPTLIQKLLHEFKKTHN